MHVDLDGNLILIIAYIEEAEDTLTTEYFQPIAERKPELCIVEVPSIIIVIETGFGYYTYPMLVIETKMNAEIRDWSSDVSNEIRLNILSPKTQFQNIKFKFNLKNNTDFN